MKKVQVNEVREQLAKYLAEAEQGEEIIILRHSKPIARLVAYKEGKPKFPDMTTFRKQFKDKGKPFQKLLPKCAEKNASDVYRYKLPSCILCT